MNFNKFLTILLILFLAACQQFDDNKKVVNYSNYLKYSNTGFTLIYDEQIKKVIKETMVSVSSSDHHMFSIPLEVSINSGNNWGEAH